MGYILAAGIHQSTSKIHNVYYTYNYTHRKFSILTSGLTECMHIGCAITECIYGRKSADCTKLGNDVIFFDFLAALFGNLEFWKVKK